MIKKSFIIVDAYGFLFRAYYILPHLNTSYGLPIGGVYGFINSLLRHLLLQDADYLVVAFDTGAKNFRHTLYPQYKIHRPQLHEDLIQQFAPLREAVDALAITREEVPNYEADDVIATLSTKYASEDVEVRIISADKDLLQLLGSNVKVFDPIKGRYLTEEYVLEKFGVTSDKLLDVLALTGDASDNIPGVPGIGVKTAARLINQFGSMDNVLSCVDQVTQQRCRESLAKYAKQAILSRDLASLCYEVKLSGDLDKYAKKIPDAAQLAAFLEKYELMSLGGRIKKYYNISLETTCEGKIAIDTEKEQHPEQLEELLDRCTDEGVLAIFWETKDGAMCELSVAYGEKSAVFLRGEELQHFLEIVTPVLDSDAVLKIVFDAKLVMEFFPNLRAFDDVMLMSYSMNAGRHDHSLESVVSCHFGGRRKTVDASTLVRLHRIMKRNLFEEKLCTVYYRFEKPLVRVLYEMQKAGIRVDVERLRQLSESFDGSIRLVEQEIYDLAGQKFNIASSKQLGHVLFECMSIGKPKKMPSGAYCTNADVLAEFSAEGVEIASKILRWRHFTKLKSTYTDAIIRQVVTETQRVHTSYSMTSAVTGRISSSNPNLQNIPVRSKEGSEIRKAFVAREGCKFVAADYSQMELKILAHIADVKAFRQAFADGQDIHSVTAQQIFGCNAEDHELRRRAKSINFGIIYGISPFGLARNVGITKKEAAKYVEQYFSSYPEIKRYMEETKAYAKTHGYTRTVFGRKCFIKGINSNQNAVRHFAERAAINAPVQGTAADIVKKAMVRLYDELTVGAMILQVHDELLMEVPASDALKVAGLVKEVMEGVASFSVPLQVDVSIGDNWGEISRLS